MLSKIKYLPKMVENLFKEFNMTHKKSIYLSFGENCLTDDILKRYNIKSFSTPYSSGRSNIEYILQIEKDRFKNFLNPEYLEYDKVDEKQVARLNTYTKLINKYNEYHMKGFEFTHHDVLGKLENRKKLQRRANRMLKLRNKEINIFYHNRYNEFTNEDMLIDHLLELKALYEKRGKTVNVFMFSQVIINNAEDRKVDYYQIKGINIYKFHVLNIWQGTDQDIFWAKCDDDLIKKMIDNIKYKKYSSNKAK